MPDRLKEILNKIPYLLIALAYLGKLGWDYYEFKNDPASPLQMKQSQLQAAKKKTEDLEERLKKIEEFNRNLEAKRTELRQLAIELDEMKTTLSEDLDVPSFVRSLVTESKRVDLKISSIRPTGEKKNELYYEHHFKIEFEGVYAQLIVFLQRLSRLKKIVLVESMDIKPIGPQEGRYVLLRGSLDLTTFRYSGSDADEKAAKHAKGKET